MDLIQMVERSRRVAESLMTDRVSIIRPGGDTQDEWGTDITSSTPVADDVPCLVQNVASNRAIAQAMAGDQSFVTDAYVAKVPIGTDIRRRDVIQLTSSLDPGHVSRRFRVMSNPTQSWSIQHRLDLDPMEEGEPV